MKILDEIILKQKDLEEKMNKLDLISKDFVEKSEIEQFKIKIEKYLLEIDKMKKYFENKLKELKEFDSQNINKRVFELERKYDEMNKNVIEIVNLLKSLVEA